MIPELLNKEGNKIGILPDCIKGVAIEERNGMCEIEITYPIFSVNWDKLERGNIIIADLNDTIKAQQFRIYKISKPLSGKIIIYARHIFFDISRDFIEEINIEKQSCEYCLNQIFKHSQFSQKFKGFSDIIATQNYNIKSINPLSAIGGSRGSILDTFGTGAELKLDNYNIYILNKRGHDNGVTIEYSKNLTGFNLDIDDSNLITRIKPFAKYTENNEEVLIFSNPKYVDSPLINAYETPFIKEIDFSDKFDDNEIPTASKLKLLAEKYFIENKCDQIKTTFKVEFIPLSKCLGYEGIQDKISLCDIVTIKDYRYKIDTKAKVIKTQYDFLSERYNSIELGEPKVTLSDLINNNNSVGPQGPQGKPGQDGKDGEEFPDTLPDVPVLEADLKGFASVDLSWTFENKVYYSYQLFASKDGNSKPNMFDLIFEGQGSSFLHQAKPGETWYYWVRGLNSYGKATELSEKLEVTTLKKDNFEEYFSSLAVENLVASIFSVDYMEAGIVKGNWIDAKQLSVTDGNGKRTLDIDSFGRVNLDVTSLKIKSTDVEKSISDNLNKINSIEQKVTPTAILNTVKENINKSNYENLILAGNFRNQDIAPNFWTKSSGLTWHLGNYTTGIMNKSANELFLYSNMINMQSITTRTLSFSCSIFAEERTKGADVFLIGSETNEFRYDWVVHLAKFDAKENKEKIMENIEVPIGINFIQIRIDHNGLRDNNFEDISYTAIYIDYINLITGMIAARGVIADKANLDNLSRNYESFKEQTAREISQKVSQNSFNNLESSFTSFKQNSDSFQFKMEKQGTANLVENSSFEADVKIVNGISSYVTACYRSKKINEIVAEDGGHFLFVEAGNGGDAYVFTELKFKFEPGKKYTISAYTRYATLGQIKGSSAFIEYWGNYDQIFGSDSFTYDWHRVASVWQAPHGHGAGVATIRLGFRCEGYTWAAYDKIKVEEGEILTSWCQSGNEVSGNVVAMNSNELKCTYEDGTYTSMTKEGFKYWTNGMLRPYQYITFTTKIGNIRNGQWTNVILPACFTGKNINIDFAVQAWAGAVNSNDFSEKQKDAIRNLFIEIGGWNKWNRELTVRPCLQKIGVMTGTHWGWDYATTTDGNAIQEGSVDILIMVQM